MGYYLIFELSDFEKDEHCSLSSITSYISDNHNYMFGIFPYSQVTSHEPNILSLRHHPGITGMTILTEFWIH